MNVAVTVNRVSTRLFTPFYENYRGRQDIQDYIRPLNQVLSDFLRVSQRLQTLCCNVIAAVNSYACGQMYFTCGILMPAKASAQPCLSCRNKMKPVWIQVYLYLLKTYNNNQGKAVSTYPVSPRPCRNITCKVINQTNTVAEEGSAYCVSEFGSSFVFSYLVSWVVIYPDFIIAWLTHRRSGFPGSRHNGR